MKIKISGTMVTVKFNARSMTQLLIIKKTIDTIINNWAKDEHQRIAKELFKRWGINWAKNEEKRIAKEISKNWEINRAKNWAKIEEERKIRSANNE